MKPSHLRTPRTMGECHVNPDMDPIEIQRRNDFADGLTTWAAVVALAAAATIMLVWGVSHA